MTIDPLDNPVWHALVGPHRVHAVGRGLALHYPRDMAPFSAIADTTAQAYADLAADLPAATEARLFRPSEEPLPRGWEQLQRTPILQMVAEGAPDITSQSIVDLVESDIDAMKALIAIAQPGPFGHRTLFLGRYLGIKQEGMLVAMAGERLRLPGYVELSAIAVHPEARGRGYAAAITAHLMRDALARGELPFLHVRLDNAAVNLYRRLGFRTRRELVVVWRRPL